MTAAWIRASEHRRTERDRSLPGCTGIRVRAYCDLYNVVLIDVIVDAGESGKSSTVPASKRHSTGSTAARLTASSSPNSTGCPAT